MSSQENGVAAAAASAVPSLEESVPLRGAKARAKRQPFPAQVVASNDQHLAENIHSVQRQIDALVAGSADGLDVGSVEGEGTSVTSDVLQAGAGGPAQGNEQPLEPGVPPTPRALVAGAL